MKKKKAMDFYRKCHWECKYNLTLFPKVILCRWPCFNAPTQHTTGADTNLHLGLFILFEVPVSALEKLLIAFVFPVIQQGYLFLGDWKNDFS